jgi:hypothetical protein
MCLAHRRIIACRIVLGGVMAAVLGCRPESARSPATATAVGSRLGALAPCYAVTGGAERYTVQLTRTPVGTDYRAMVAESPADWTWTPVAAGGFELRWSGIDSGMLISVRGDSARLSGTEVLWSVATGRYEKTWRVQATAVECESRAA